MGRKAKNYFLYLQNKLIERSLNYQDAGNLCNRTPHQIQDWVRGIGFKCVLQGSKRGKAILNDLSKITGDTPVIVRLEIIKYAKETGLLNELDFPIFFNLGFS